MQGLLRKEKASNDWDSNSQMGRIVVAFKFYKTIGDTKTRSQKRVPHVGNTREGTMNTKKNLRLHLAISSVQ